eukprot:TRINITY_DN16052_c0_g1_i1.p2 TRINITY_DN16052_c0_g1~~TRINITY_DN16052_c0_g1_i1.p2  ORF type:complete len:314 (+),score=57.05 TRINITY_DN16052_c0_g1_i1:85-1026(+)
MADGADPANVSRRSSRAQPHELSGGPADGNGWLLEAEKVFSSTLLATREQRTRLALGDQYEVLRPDDRMEVLGEALDDVRQARRDERMRLLEECRRVELEERLRLFSSEERVLHEEQHRLAAAARAIRKRARSLLNAETEAAKWLEQQKFEADKKFIIDHERSQLLRRRRDYEARVQAVVPPSQRPASPVGSAPGDVAPGAGSNNVVLVMTVAIGANKEDVITVRELDNHHDLAYAFVTRHGLPEDVVEPLVREIRSNIANPPPRAPPQGDPDGLSFHPQLSPGTVEIAKGRSQEPVFDRLYPESLRTGRGGP